MSRHESAGFTAQPAPTPERGGDRRRHAPTCLGQSAAGAALLERLLVHDVPPPAPIEGRLSMSEEAAPPQVPPVSTGEEEGGSHHSHIDYLLGRAAL